MAKKKKAASKKVKRSATTRATTGRSTAKASGVPVGLDLGTSTVVMARQNGRGVRAATELNAFIELPTSKFTEQILAQNKIDYVRDNGRIVVYGNGASKFANMFNTETRRPMRHGLVNGGEPHAQKLLEVIVTKLLGKKAKGETVYFSVPAAPKSSSTSLVYHEALMKQMLDGMGYDARAINEGLAVVFSELEQENFSGLGISFGGGLTNVCLAYLSVPVFTFAIERGGDDVDEAVGDVTGETATRVRALKEEGINLAKKPRNKVAEAIHIYYNDLIDAVVTGIAEALSQTDRMPKLDRSLTVVLGGGSALPRGFRDRFEEELSKQELPIEIHDVKLAKDPLTATARGALIAAQYEN